MIELTCTLKVSQKVKMESLPVILVILISDFGDVECDRNLEDVKSNIMSIFERLSKNKQFNDLRENIMFVLDKVTNLQGQNQALQKQLEESNLKMKKVSKASSEVT
jgi:hypothetical protein